MIGFDTTPRTLDPKNVVEKTTLPALADRVELSAAASWAIPVVGIWQ